ncbi:SRPBCC family protein [Cryptosporangium sp. NPDC048952]|uniref:SRPBCC family protein n=1 Tax=Cryptosporangium sp. NPDC048952 TaxID=3363961 RepID=UPI003715BFA3
MDLTHQFHVPAGIDDAWAHFQDVSGVAACFPGAQVTSVEGDEFTGSCKVKLGPIALVYNGSGSFSERDESKHRMVVEAKGRDKRGNGTASATATLSMAAAADGGTDVEVVTDLAITGKPAQFGRGLIQDVSDKLLGQFVDCLAQQLAPAADPAPTPTPPPPPPAADTPAARTPSPAADTPAARTPSPAAQAVATASAGRVVRTSPPQPEALDLGATVLPVLARSYWKPALAVLVALAVIVRLLRRRSS